MKQTKAEWRSSFLFNFRCSRHPFILFLERRSADYRIKLTYTPPHVAFPLILSSTLSLTCSKTHTMFYLFQTTLLLLLSTFATASPAPSAPPPTDMQCVNSCTDWSITLGYCRGEFGPARKPLVMVRSTQLTFSAQYKNFTFANDFVGCLCRGDRTTEAIGNESMVQSVGICSTCETTPNQIKKDISVSVLRSCLAL